MFTNATLIYANVVRQELQSCLSEQGAGIVRTSPPVRIFSEGMKNAMLREAVRFAECSISNVAHALQLLKRNYTDWPIVTYYYTSFYAICALLRTKGYAMTYVDARAYQIEPDPEHIGSWWYTSLSGDRGHLAVWNQFDACFGEDPPADWDNLKPLTNPDEREIRTQHNYQPDIMGEELHQGSQKQNENANLLRADLFGTSEIQLTDEQQLLRRSQHRTIAAVQAVVLTLRQTNLEYVCTEGMRRLRRALNQYNNLLPPTFLSELNTALQD